MKKGEKGERINNQILGIKNFKSGTDNFQIRHDFFINSTNKIPMFHTAVVTFLYYKQLIFIQISIFYKTASVTLPCRV